MGYIPLFKIYSRAFIFLILCSHYATLPSENENFRATTPCLVENASAILDQEFPITEAFKVFIKNNVEKILLQKEATLSPALQKCYEILCDNPTCLSLPTKHLLGAFPELITAFHTSI